MSDRSDESVALGDHLFKKRWFIALATVTLMLIVATTVITFPQIRSARAASPGLILEPASAAYTNTGNDSIKVQGSAYAANETVNIYWNYRGPGTGKLKVTATSDATGTFNTKFTIPLAATGTYTVAGVGQTNDIASASFKLLPFLYVTPRAAGAATTLTIYGFAFGAGETVNVYWGYTGPGTGSLLTTAAADSTGSFTVKSPVPTDATPGRIPVAGVGQTSLTRFTYLFHLYPPTLALAPLSGSAGITLTLSALGFQANEKVSLYWNGGSTPIGSPRATDQFGYMAPTTITVPAGTAPGSYTITSVGSLTNLRITNSYTVVAPGSRLNVTSGPVGATVKVSGQGYAPREQVNFLWNYTGPGTGAQVASVTAGPSGTFDGSFIVPLATNGAYPVAAVGPTSNRVTRNTFILGDGLAVNPSATSPNTKVTAAGTGFTTGESVKLYFDKTTGTLLGTATANAQGNINQFITIPITARPGAHQVVGVGQTSSVSFSTPITIDTAWSDFGFQPGHHRQNYAEFGLGATNVANLKLKWTSAPTATNLESSPVYANGTVYVTTSDGQLNAYDATSGTLKWNFDSKTGFENLSAPVVDPTTNTIYFGTIGHEFPGVPSPSYALDTQTGTLKWSLILPRNDFGFPTIALKTIYVGASSEGQGGSLMAIDVASGKIDWQVGFLQAGVWGAASVDITTNVVITGVGNPDNTIEAFNAKTGAHLWTYSVPNSTGDYDIGSAIDIAGGLVFANSKNGNVYALHESDGSFAWATQINANIDDVSSPAYSTNGGTKGTVFVGSLSGFVYSLDAATGAINWNVPVGGSVWSSPAIANGVVYVSTGVGSSSFYALNTTNGATLWSFKPGAKSYSSPIVVNGWLYCNATNGKLYAFSL